MSSKAPANLVAFPSLSSSLNSLPQATSLSNVAVHPNMYAQRAAESQAKLQKAISKTASSNGHSSHQHSAYPSTMHNASDSSSLMMRKPSHKTK